MTKRFIKLSLASNELTTHGWSVRQVNDAFIEATKGGMFRRTSAVIMVDSCPCVSHTLVKDCEL